MQRLLQSADWDTTGARDDVLDVVVEQLRDRDGVLTVDDGGFLKRCTRSGGLARR
jgi:SRSO17 transposase